MTVEKKISTEKVALQQFPFASARLWEQWLDKNHEVSKGIWLQIFKKKSGIDSVTYAEALDVALCYGWIDGQLKSIDELSYMQRFTPRRKRSLWSKRNIEHITRLLEAGRMKPAGIKEAEDAKTDGRWDKAYDSPGKMILPDDFRAELAKDLNALSFYESLNKANKYAVCWRIQTARNPEVRARKMNDLIEMLKRGEKIHA